MATALRFSLLFGMHLVACSETAPEENTAPTSGTSSTGGAGGAGIMSSAESSGLTGMGGSEGPSAGESAASLTTTSTSASAPSSTSVSVTGAAGTHGTSSGGAGPAAGGSMAGAGGNAGSAGSAAGGGGGSGALGGAGGTSEPGGLESFTLAVIGSSTAAGEGATSDGWVSLLAKELEERVLGDFAANNLSVGGYATSDLMPGSNSDGNVDDALDHAPNLIIVALAGSNDLSNGVSTETFLTRLATIRDAAVEAGVSVFFVGTAPKDLSDDEREMLLDWTNRMRQEFDACWTPLATNYSPCFIDVFVELADSSLGIADEYGAGDGIHLNDAGHRRIFEIAESIVRPYVCSMTDCAP